MSLPFFRINMRVGYAGNIPATPVPPDGAPTWVDVTNWQNFLNTHNCPATNPPNDMFGMVDQNATKTFQTRSSLPATGIVNLATYNAAVAAGMPAYPTVTT